MMVITMSRKQYQHSNIGKKYIYRKLSFNFVTQYSDVQYLPVIALKHAKLMNNGLKLRLATLSQILCACKVSVY